MSLPLLGVSEQGQRTTLVPSSPSIDSGCDKDSELKERYYLGLSDCSSVDSSVGLSLPEENKNHINLKATELRLGLPGSRSPERNSDIFLSQGKHDEKPLFPLVPMKDGICSSSQKHVISGNKREFCDTMDGFSEVKSSVYAQKNWMFHAGGAESESRQSAGQGNYAGNSAVNVMVSSRPSGTQSATMKDLPLKAFQERSGTANGSKLNQTGASIKSSSVPTVKAQVVGWPPIKSCRKNSLATTSKNNEEVDGKPGPVAFLVKVSMDGAPYLRKVDLRTFSTYQELSSALENMFSSFTIGAALGREKIRENKVVDLLHGSEYVLTYEDKDGDWMLVGDVPWEMFIDSCKRLKIMKSSDAIGLGNSLKS